MVSQPQSGTTLLFPLGLLRLLLRHSPLDASVAEWLCQPATVLGMTGSNLAGALVIQRFISQASIQTFNG